MQFDFREFSPPDALRPFLRRSFYARGQIPYRYDKILPNGLAVVIFTIGGSHRLGPLETVDRNPLFDHSWFHGVQTRPVYNRPLGETHVLGLLFEPIGFHALFHIDMQRYVDQTVDAQQVLPADVVVDIEAALPDASDAATHASLHAALLNRQRTSSRHDGLLHRASHRTGHADHASGSLDWSIKMPAQAGQIPAGC